MKWLIFLYTVNTLCAALWGWMEYLDVRTTYKNVLRGARELNPELQPYVHKGDFWLEVRGKLRNAAVWCCLVCLIIPIFPVFLFRAWSIWKSVHINEQVAGKLKPAKP